MAMPASSNVRFTIGPRSSPPAGASCYEKRKGQSQYDVCGQKVGVSQVGEQLWLVSFMDFDLGYFADETCRLEPIENPFWRKVLPMCPE